jgi:hypothetical protein
MSPLFRPAFTTLVMVGVVYQLTLYFHLFFIAPSFDMVMHFLGGFLISIGVLAIVSAWIRDIGELSYGEILAWGFVSALIVGLAWEYFELSVGITEWSDPRYAGDSGMDIVMDSFGALVAVWFVYYKVK